MNFRTVLLLTAAGTVLAQEPPRAQPVDPALRPDAGRDWYLHGRNLYEAAKQNADPDGRAAGYQRAIEVFSRYLNEFPDNENAERAWWFLGLSYYESGRVEDANRCFHTLLNRYQGGRYATAAAYTLGYQHYQRRQYALAATLFEKMAAMATTPAERLRGQFNAALCYELQGRTREATDYYRKVLADPDPANPFVSRAQFSLGRLLARSDKNEEALELLDKVVMSNSEPKTRGQAAVLAGSIAAKLGREELSDKYLNLVLGTAGMEESRAEAQLALMEARFSAKKYREVVDIFRRSPEKAEGEREAARLMLAARSYMMLGNNVEALELFREVERLPLPDDRMAFEANYLRLNCFFRIEGRHVPEQVDAFLQLYRKKRPRDPKIHTALLMKAESLRDAKELGEAAKVYSEIDPKLLSASNRPGYLYNLGWIHGMTEDPNGLIRAFDSFLKEFPDDPRVPQALVQRAKAHADTGNQEAALADYDRLIALGSPSDLVAEAWIRSADIARAQGALDEMIRRYRGFVEKAPDADDARKAKANYWLAWGLLKTEKAKDAVPHAEIARKLAPKSFGERAGSLLCFAYGALGDLDKLCEELDRAIEGNYSGNMSEQLIRVAAVQAFNASRFDQAARFYTLIADYEEPGATPREVWRFLGKSLLHAGKAKEALEPINHALTASIDNGGLRADGLLDKGRALLRLGRIDEALSIAEEGMLLRPQGHVNAGLSILRGDALMKKDRPADAAGDYVRVVELMDDNDRILKPEAMHKLIQALEKNGRAEDAARYREQLRQKFPDWKPGTDN